MLYLTIAMCYRIVQLERDAESQVTWSVPFIVFPDTNCYLRVSQWHVYSYLATITAQSWHGILVQILTMIEYIKYLPKDHPDLVNAKGMKTCS